MNAHHLNSSKKHSFFFTTIRSYPVISHEFDTLSVPVM